MKNILYKAATESGKIIKEYFEGSFKIESKDIVSNLVTEVDKKSEAKIIEIIKSDFPEHNILSEEIGALETDSEFKWIIDPIDGTINYAHGIPICCVSIAVEKAREIIYGLVYNPIAGEMFYAEKGKGAFYNDEKILVTKESNLKKSLLVTGFPYVSSKIDKPIKSFASFLNMDIPIRRLGSAALDLCWTALGRFDGLWEYNLNPWDVAAGYLIMTEAGGKVTDFKGEKFSIYGKEILATNGLIHEQMLEVLKKI